MQTAEAAKTTQATQATQATRALRTVSIVLALTSFTATIAPAQQAEAAASERSSTLTGEEREELLAMLDQTGAELRDLIEATSEEQWTWKPAADRWSVGECVEHLLLTEAALFDTARQALDTPATPDWAERTEGKEELLRRVMPNRRPQGAGGASAPQEVRPTGEMDREAALELLEAQRAEVREFVQALDAPLRQHLSPHPFPVFGDLSAYEWLLYIPLHTTRHTRQAIEVRETDGYPAAD